MKIGLIDADLMDHGTRHPNLALMKIAGYYKDQGNSVQLIFDDYNSVKKFDQIFISKVFTFSKIPDWVIKLPNVSYGGTGFFEDGGPNLSYEIEHHMPYYDLYKEYVDTQLSLGHNRSYYADYLDFSIGFTSRGCFRKCSFCINKKYDHAFSHSPINEFLDPDKPYIYLWDDNILALPEWEKVLDDIEATNKPFQFRQGIDIRLMTDKKAKRLINSRYYGDFIFAFDHIQDKELIIEKVQLWHRYSSKICKMYVICAYKSQDENNIIDVFERIHTLMHYGSLPYIMRYEDYKISDFKTLYIQIARWCNQPNFFKKKSFREFCVANQNYKKNQNTYCSAYKAMLDFEKAFPEIANKYFDLKFEDENYYLKQYGYGRKYANKPLCKSCKKKGIFWESFLNDEINPEDILGAYFTKEIDLECLRYKMSECSCTSYDVAEKLVKLILVTPIDKIIDIIKCQPNKEEVTKDNIPQFSKLNDAKFSVSQILFDSDEILSFEKLGFYLTRHSKDFKSNEIANKKYGENHAKMAALLDLVTIDKSGKRALVELSELGKYYVKLDDKKKEDISIKLCLRIPIVQNYFIFGSNEKKIEENLCILSKETKKRRRSNVKFVIRSIEEKFS